MEDPSWKDRVLKLTKAAQDAALDPVAWAVRVGTDLEAVGVELPSPELGVVLVEYLCWGNNVPAVWKFVEKAIDARLAPAVVVLALLSRRVIPVRRSRPAAYRLYLEILKRHSFSFAFKTDDPNYKRIMSLVDDVLHLSEAFGGQPCEPGVLIVEYFLHVIWKLLYATLDDEGLLDLTSERYLKWDKSQDMEIDAPKIFDEKISEQYGKLVKANTVMAIEIIGQYLHHKVISRLLSLAHQNMSSHWEGFSQCLHLLAANSLALQSSSVPPEALFKWSSDTRNKLHWQCKPSQYREFCVISSGPLASPGGNCHGSSRSAIWVPLDLYFEDAMDGPVAATNAIEIVSGLLKALQAVNRTTWHDAFLGLWMAALRMVQRERDPIEGPVPHEDTRMCMLLSVTTLSIADIIGEDEATAINSHESQLKGNAQIGPRRAALITSLQQLGDYESLLTPPPSVISVANQAAAKAMVFVSGIPVGSGFNESIGLNTKLKCSGNMRHLIVEACIARNLLDTSAYYWPGYVSGRISQIPHGMSSQVLGWSALMKGAPLTPPLINALMSIPAPSFAELEKVFDMAVNGSDNDRISAATILCGASLIRGWNVQEYTVRLVVKLLSPPIPVGYSGSSSHLIAHAPVLDVVLPGISTVDCVQVFSFHGLVPELAAALMAVCEVFGSCIPKTTWTLSTGEEVSAHTVFSNAFILLLRLWEFNHTPLEYIVMGDGAPVGSQLTPEYLLLLRNISSGGMINKKNSRQLLTNSIKDDIILVDSFPKLKVWYCQHQACLASTLTGLVPGSPVHQNVDTLLAMMFRKANKGSNQTVGSVASGSSSLSSSSITGSEDATPRPKLPAWDIMEAVPYAVDAALTACSHGRVSPRELATGLKDLADFLPASLATIVSYFSSEVTRGIWKPANMNGTDWPSPAANLTVVEENIKKIVAATGADVPSLVKARSSEATLPLPLAAFVSLTITYKLDKGSQRFLNLAGPALENLAASCPWPSMPIVASLWTQKVKRWSDFLTFSASRTVFHHNNNALVQLLESCFGATLGFSTTLASGNGGVGRLLGHGFGSHFSGGLSPVAPGILYLRIYRSVRDFMFITEEILSLLILSVREVANKSLPKEARGKLRKSRNGTRYGQVSLIAVLTQVKVAAYLGATLVWLSGGPGIIQCMFREMLPSWFLSMHNSDQGGQNGMVAVLEGYALAYFGVLCGMFAWGICATPVSKRKYKVISTHLQFIADALDGKISLGCSRATWHAYVSGFLGLVVDCTPGWLRKMELPLLKRLSMGLRLWNEDELAFLLLEKAGPSAMGAAAEFIISSTQ